MTWREVEVTWEGKVYYVIQKWLETCDVDNVSVISAWNRNKYIIEGDPHHVGRIKQAMVDLGAKPEKDIGPKTSEEASRRAQEASSRSLTST